MKKFRMNVIVGKKQILLGVHGFGDYFAGDKRAGGKKLR